MPEFITIRECLDIMKSGTVSSLTCVTYDSKRNKGGELLEIAEAELLTAEKMEAEKIERQGRPLTLAEFQTIPLSPADNPRNPNHGEHHTRNIRILCDGHPTADIIKVHPPLFMTFNGRTVMP